MSKLTLEAKLLIIVIVLLIVIVSILSVSLIHFHTIEYWLQRIQMS